MDQPPLSIGVLALNRALLGDSLLALRILPAVAGAATVYLTGLMARELGGGRYAQALAALAALAAPVYLAIDHIFTMNAFDVLLWTGAVYLWILCLRNGTAGRWILLGALLGLGLLNKIGVLWLGAGILVALLLTPDRKLLLSRGPWVAALVALLLFLPHLLWQIAHGWPTLEFIRNAREMKMVSVSPPAFLAEQILVMGPGSVPIWVAGIPYGLLARDAARWRGLVFLYLTVLAVLVLARTSKAEYLTPTYPALFALGSVALERAAARRGFAWIRAAAVILLVGIGALIAPLATPLLPLQSYLRYQSAIGIKPSSGERQRVGILPQHYADMFGWEEMAREVAGVYRSLRPEERARCAIFTQNYGEAGAIDFFGRRLGIPRAASGHNSYWLWGPPKGDPTVLILVGGGPEDYRDSFERVDPAAVFRCRYCMPYEQDLPIYVGRGLRSPIARLWPGAKHYI